MASPQSQCEEQVGHRCAGSQLQVVPEVLAPPLPASLSTPHFPEVLTNWGGDLVTMWVTWSSRLFRLLLPRALPVAESGTVMGESALAQVFLAEIRAPDVQGAMGQSQPSQACRLWRTLLVGCTGCGPHTLLTHFPPRAPAIPNDQCDFLLL